MDQYKEIIQLIAVFNETHDNADLGKLMALLTAATVCVPAKLPPILEQKAKEAAKMGRQFSIPKNQPMSFMLMSQEDGTKVFPIFLGKDQIPEGKMPPLLVNMPFLDVVKHVKASNGLVGRIAVNPFTGGITLAEPMIDLIMKQLEQPVKRKVEMTVPEIHAMCHKMAAFDYLPKKFYKDPAGMVEALRTSHEQELFEAYQAVYPQEYPCQYEEDDFSVMVLSLSDTLQVARMDFPSKNLSDGIAIRAYAALLEGGKAEYFVVIKQGEENKLARVDEKSNVTMLDNDIQGGQELETIMELVQG